MNDDGGYAFARSGVQPAFDPAAYWGHGTEPEGSDDDGAVVADAQHIVTANGTFAYDADCSSFVIISFTISSAFVRCSSS